MALSERERFEHYIRQTRDTPVVRDVYEIMDEFTHEGDTVPALLDEADALDAMLDGWDPPPQKDRRLL